MPTITPAPGTVVEVEKQMEAAAEALMEMPQAPASGASAVQESMARQALSSADTLAATGEGARNLRHALDKAFAYQAGLWVDTSYRDTLPRQELAFGSEAYFDLLSAHPEWAPYLAVSSSLIVVLDGTAYVITDFGEPLAEVPEASPTITDDLGETVSPTPESPAVLATIPAMPSPESMAVQQNQAPAAGQAPFCAAPALGVALLLGPALLLRRRPSGGG